LPSNSLVRASGYDDAAGLIEPSIEAVNVDEPGLPAVLTEGPTSIVLMKNENPQA